ncbi:MAG: hypothetical protein R3B70_01185 [Polyangiaceae bacterium]
MSPSARNPTPDPKAPAPSGVARWLDLVTTAVLGLVVLLVLAVAAPSLLRAGEKASAEPDAFPPPYRANHPTLVPRDHPRSFPIDDEPFVEEPPSLPGQRGRDVRPNDPRAAPPSLPGREPDDDDESGAMLGLKGGITVKPLLLRDRATGTVVHEVKPGQPVSILREDGDWVFILQRSRDELVSGWARRNELLLR